MESDSRVGSLVGGGGRGGGGDGGGDGAGVVWAMARRGRISVAVSRLN
jgi:hypothetical protein